MLKMKNLILATLLLLFAIPALAQEKTDDELLRETEALSKEVKEFGKILGIEPSEALSKSSKEQKAILYFGIGIQKKGSVSLKTFSRSRIFFETEKMPPFQYSLWNPLYSVYIRTTAQFSGGDSVITPSFAKEPLPRKVMTIFHEDLHDNIWSEEAMSANMPEILVTPLGFLAALKFFENKNDAPNIQEATKQIENFRKMSQELNLLEKDLEALSKENPFNLLCLAMYEKEILKSYPTYEQRLLRAIGNREECASEEAAISEDLMYLKYFEKIVVLYEKSKDLKMLIEDMKNAPGTQDVLEKYLDELDKKYSVRNSSLRTPLP